MGPRLDRQKQTDEHNDARKRKRHHQKPVHIFVKQFVHQPDIKLGRQKNRRRPRDNRGKPLPPPPPPPRDDPNPHSVYRDKDHERTMIEPLYAGVIALAGV